MMGGMKDTGGQQSRFKWMMEGHSPAPSPPDTALHKNGRVTQGSSHDANLSLSLMPCWPHFAVVPLFLRPFAEWSEGERGLSLLPV